MFNIEQPFFTYNLNLNNEKIAKLNKGSKVVQCSRISAKIVEIKKAEKFLKLYHIILTITD